MSSILVIKMFVLRIIDLKNGLIKMYNKLKLNTWAIFSNNY